MATLHEAGKVWEEEEKKNHDMLGTLPPQSILLCPPLVVFS